MEAPITFAEDRQEILTATPQANGTMMYTTKHNGILFGELGGAYQAKNMNTILIAAYLLAIEGFLCYCEKKNNQEKCRLEIQQAISSVTKLTGLQGRWQILQQQPTVICDTGHNVGGWQYLSQQLKQLTCRQLHIVFGMVEDKDIDGVLELLPKNAIYYFTQADNKRAINASSLQLKATKYGLTGKTYPTVHEAFTECMRHALRDDAVFVGGSSYVVGDLLKTLN